MKKLKRVMCTVVATIMASFACVMPISVSAETAEQTNEVIIDLSNVEAVEVLDNGDIVYEMEVPSDIITPPGDEINSSLTQNILMTRSAESIHRTYTGNRLQYTVKATKSNGSACGNVISAQLWDNVHTTSLTDTRVTANGSNVTIYNVPITSGRTYYFKFVLTSGTATSLKVSLSATSFTAATS